VGESEFVLVSDFDYHLPEELIAKEPLADRAAARMLHVDRESDQLEDREFRELPELLRLSDRILVLNQRRLAAVYDARDATQEQIMAAATE